MAAQTTKRAIKALERELESRGVELAPPQAATGRTCLSLSVWYVAVNDTDKRASASMLTLSVCT